MKTFGIWTNTKTGTRIAILDELEAIPDFDPKHYFRHVATPEREGEIQVEDENCFLDDYFCVQTDSIS
jgi:hypothetical protein